jgi:hypothetical protein
MTKKSTAKKRNEKVPVEKEREKMTYRDGMEFRRRQAHARTGQSMFINNSRLQVASDL